MIHKSFITSSVLASSIFLVHGFLPCARAQSSLTWDADTGTSGAQDGAGTWDAISSNWWDGASHTTFSTGDHIQFGAANVNSNYTVLMDGNFTAGNVVFGPANNIPRYTLDLNGNTLTVTGDLNLHANSRAPGGPNSNALLLNNGTIQLAKVGSSQASPDIFLDPNDGADWGVIIGATVNVGTGNRYIRGAPQRNDFDRYFGDLVFDGPIAGSANLYFSGTTTDNNHNMHFGLNAANTGFTGGVTLGDHTDLTLLDTQALTSANNVTFNTTTGRATLFLYGHNVTIGNLNDTSTGGTRNIRNGSLDEANGGTNLSDHGQQADAVLTVHQTAAGTFGGTLANGPNDDPARTTGTYRTLGLTKTGSATLTLTGATTYTGPTTLSGGILDFAASSAQTLSGTITGAGGQLRYSGSSTLTLTNASNDYSGGTIWANGHLTIHNGTALGTGALNITKTSSGTLTVANTDDVTLSNPIVLPASGTATYSIVKNTSGIGSGKTLTYDGILSGGASGLTLLLNSGTGGDYTTTHRFTGANTFRANITLNRGVLTIAHPSAMGDAANSIKIDTNANLTDGSLRFEQSMTLPNPVSFTYSSMYGVNTYANNVTLSGIISGDKGITKLGSGILTLTHAGNTNTGNLEITDGTFAVSGGGRLNSGTYAGNITNNANLLMNTSATQTLSGVITGTGAFTKSNTGILNLGNAGSTFSGPIHISAGQLRATAVGSVSNGPLGSGPITIGTGAALHFYVPSGSTNTFTNDIQLPTVGSQQFIIGSPATTTTVRLTGQITGGAAGQTFRLTDTTVMNNHNSVLILDNPNNNFQGRIEMWRGTLAFTSDEALGHPDNDIRHYTESLDGSLRFDADNITLNSNRSIELVSNNDPINTQAYNGTIAGTITGAGTLVKQGSGTLTLTGNNTHTGQTRVTAGTLLIHGNNNPAAGMITVSLDATLGGTGSMGNVTVEDGAFLAPGASAGTITIQNLTLSDGSFLDFELGAPNLGVNPGSDHIAVQQALTLAGTLHVTALTGFSAASGDRWLLATYAPGNLISSGVAIGSAPPLGGGLSFEVDTLTDGSVFLVVVPEPGVAGLMGVGMLVLLFLRREKSL